MTLLREEHQCGTRASQSAVVLVDVINLFDYPGAEQLLANLRQVVPTIRRLKDWASAQGWPIVYANDNFGQWRSDFANTHRQALQGPGADVAAALAPEACDYFVLKPHRSAFFRTPLENLLRSLNVEALIIAGITTDMCVLATVSEALQRGFSTCVPLDACASISDESQALSLRLLTLSQKTRVLPVAELIAERSEHPDAGDDPGQDLPRGAAGTEDRRSSG